MSDDTIDKVWIPRHPDEHPFHWTVGEVVKLNVEQRTIEVDINSGRISNSNSDEEESDGVSGERRLIPLDHTRPFVERHLQDWNDILAMGDLHDASLLELLRRRFRCGSIYTYAGPVLVLLNPYEMVDKCSVESPPEEGTPHLFDLARNVVSTMANAGPKGLSQSILVNGESGAGKTEACKSIVRYLAYQSRQRKKLQRSKETEEMNGYFKGLGIGTQRANPVLGGRGRGRGRAKGAPSTVQGRGLQLGSSTPRTCVATEACSDDDDGSDDHGSIENLIISTNPLLEAFGNAVTICNNNSSRFGKFIQLYYDDKESPIASANTLHFLLEKSRILHHAGNERNYHIFYQLLAAFEAGVLDREIEAAQLEEQSQGKTQPEPYRESSSSIPCDASTVTSVSLSSTTESMESTCSKSSSSSKKKSKALLPSKHAYDYRMLVPSIGASAMSSLKLPDELTEDRAKILESKLGKVVLMSDLENFRATCLALKVVGVSKSEQAQLWRILSGLLVLSNVNMKTTSEAKGANVEGCRVSRKSRKTLKHAAGLLGVNPDRLQEKLCFRTLVVGRGSKEEDNSATSTTVPLSAAQARESLDALIKSIYTSIFDWIIDRVNSSSSNNVTQRLSASRSGKTKRKLFVGILDIFGFEVLETNSFEQLCINYANEILQRLFDQSMFDWEKKEYMDQDVDCAMLSYQDNSELLKVFDDPMCGLFPLLNQQCVIGNGDRQAGDAAYYAKVLGHYMQPTNHSPHFSIAKHGSASSTSTKVKPFQVYRGPMAQVKKRTNSIVGASFVVHHFICDVLYDTRGFVAKNIDSLQRDLIALFGSADSGDTECSSPLLVEVVSKFAIGTSPSDTGLKQSNPLSPRSALQGTVTGKKNNNRKMAQLKTVGARFSEQINALQMLLVSTGLNFVRCIRPNGQKEPKVWQPELVLNQLVFLGVMNLVRIRNEGYPVRREFHEVLSRFPEIVTDAAVKWNPGKNDEAACRALLTHALSNTDLESQWQMGYSLCFLKNAVLEKLNHIVRQKRNEGVARLKYLERRKKAKEQAKVQNIAATVVQSFGRMIILRMRFVRQQAALRITSFIRIAPSRYRFLRLRRAVSVLQAQFRGTPVRGRLLQLKHATIVIQRFAQRCLLQIAVQEYVRVEQEWTCSSAAIKIQSFARMVLVHLKVERAKYYFSRLQCVWRSYIVRKQYMKIVQHREPYRSLLRPNEAVLHTSLVVKTTEKGKTSLFKVVSKKKRQLILTTGPKPRLFYAEPNTHHLKGEIVWHPTKTFCVVSGESGFEVQSIPSLEKGKTKWKFIDLSSDPVKWMRAISEPKTVAELINSRCLFDAEADSRNNMVLKQGYVLVLEYGTRKNWKRRWLRLQGLEIRLYTSEYEQNPICCITVDSRVNVHALEGDPSDFDTTRTIEIVAPLFPLGLKIRCHTHDERLEWLEMVDLIVQSERYRDEASLRSTKKGKSLLRKYDDLIAEKNQEIDQLREALNKYRSQQQLNSTRKKVRDPVKVVARVPASNSDERRRRRSFAKAEW